VIPSGLAPAVVVFDFDPVGVVLGFAVRWQIAAVAAVIFATLLLAGALAVVAERRRVARLMRDPERGPAVAEAARAAEETLRASVAASHEPDVPAAGPEPAMPAIGPEAAVHVTEAESTAMTSQAPERASAPPPDDRPWPVGLRSDDLLFIVAGGIAGAVAVGRLGWVLLYLDFYRAHQDAILDVSVGGLTLAGGVVGGVVAGMAMAAVLGAPVARWLGVAIVPLLLALGLGKLAMVLGGAGQGLPSDASWATAYAGPGPWGSLAPLIPSHPAQVYEALTSAGALLIVLLLALVPAFRRHPAALFAVGIGLWAVGRFAVAFTWRDPLLVGDLNGDQVVTSAIVAVALVWLLGIVVKALRGRRGSTGESVPTGTAAPAVVAFATVAAAAPDGPVSDGTTTTMTVAAAAPGPAPAPPRAPLDRRRPGRPRGRAFRSYLRHWLGAHSRRMLRRDGRR
jgi:phosphatidylglycerol:prolipoprotein diacylglycerol transferase